MTVIDPLSLLVGCALYPVVRRYWRLLISGINSLRDYKATKTVRQETSVTIDDFAVIGMQTGRLLFKEVKTRGFIEFKKYEEGEYVIES